jgi:lipopolysaccharide/colanic/teichoic acid biosynthesis glycosyltransferase
MFHKDGGEREEYCIRRPSMSQDITNPKITSESPEYFQRTAGHDAHETHAQAERLSELLIAIALALPVLLTIALLCLVILGTMGRPALVRQERVGRRGTIFKQLKLRTRAVGSTSEHQDVTPLGRFLEDSYLAELPKLWHVAVGDMSIRDLSQQSSQEVYRDKTPNNLFPGTGRLPPV